jgi:hypothetical protein
MKIKINKKKQKNFFGLQEKDFIKVMKSAAKKANKEQRDLLNSCGALKDLKSL